MVRKHSDHQKLTQGRENSSLLKSFVYHKRAMGLKRRKADALNYFILFYYYSDSRLQTPEILPATCQITDKHFKYQQCLLLFIYFFSSEIILREVSSAERFLEDHIFGQFHPPGFYEVTSLHFR